MWCMVELLLTPRFPPNPNQTVYNTNPQLYDSRQASIQVMNIVWPAW